MGDQWSYVIGSVLIIPSNEGCTSFYWEQNGVSVNGVTRKPLMLRYDVIFYYFHELLSEIQLHTVRFTEPGWGSVTHSDQSLSGEDQ